MKPVAFTCCVNYSDMLALTWPLNRDLFDAFIVVTSTDDKRTQEYCRDKDILCLISDSYKQDGSPFNRAAMLNRAIEVCAVTYPDEWLVSMDVDVVLDVIPYNRALIVNTWIAGWCGTETQTPFKFGGELDEGLIYGCPRKLIKEPCAVTLESLRAHPAPWERYPYNLCAYLGYFQMFYDKWARNDESYKTVNNSDTAFLDNNFGINKARTFTNLVAYHLGENGVNWNGRVSKEWK